MHNCNSGYVGYSMSVRAVKAYNNGFMPKTAFKKEFSISEKKFQSFIEDENNFQQEWHHCSKFFNKVYFFKPTDKGLAVLKEMGSEYAAYLFECEIFDYLQSLWVEKVETITFPFECSNSDAALSNSRKVFYEKINAAIKWASKDNPNPLSSHRLLYEDNITMITAILN